MLFALLPKAEGFTPVEFDLATASDPSIQVNVRHTPTNPDPKQGDTFTYTMDFILDKMVEPSTTRTLTVTVQADVNAPFASLPQVGDFRYVDGSTAQGTREAGCTTTSCTFTFTDLPNSGTLRFTEQAKVVSELGPGAVITANADAKTNTALSVALEEVWKSAPRACQGTFTFKQLVSKGGAYLADIKFADVNGLGKVMLTQGDRTIRAHNDPNASGDTIKFETPDGQDITHEMMKDATYIAKDPIPPHQLAESRQAGQFARSVWLDSLNWPYDPSTFTGSTWIPAGTVITVTRQVTYANCLPGGFAGDLDTERPFGIATEIGRKSQETTESGRDVFSMPGRQPPAQCVNNAFVSTSKDRSTTGRASNLYLWDPALSGNARARNLTSNAEVMDSIAATDRYPTKVFAVDKRGGELRAYDTSVIPPNETLLRVPAPAGWNIKTTESYSAAFHPNGSLYMTRQDGQVYYLKADQIATLIEGGSATWNPGAKLAYQGRDIYVRDFVFDGDGKMYLISGDRSDMYLSTFENGQYDSGLQNIKWIKHYGNFFGIGVTRGLAFVGDKLYASGWYGETIRTTVLHEIDWKSGTYAHSRNLASTLGFAIGNPSDMASCSFPEKNPATPGPAFRVQKSIVNPDGSIQEAGTTGAKRTLNPDGTVTIDYLVTVFNTGTQPGVFPTITDSVTVPPGFTVSGVYLDGVRQSSTSTFAISGKSLDPFGQSGSSSATYEVRIKAKAPDLNAVDWAKAGTCDTAGAGTPSAGGFFNLVTMDRDGDGPDNNDACVPVTSAQLKLVKQIVDADGRLVQSSDSKAFDLMAIGSSYLKGASPNSGAMGPDSRVLPGTYRLYEQGNDNGAISGKYRMFANWACSNDGAPVPVEHNAIDVADGMTVQCVIKNTSNPVVHVVKTAADPIAGNDHIGKTIAPNPDGTLVATYHITVTNTSGFTTTTGPVWDRFLVPKGLVWDGAKQATVSVGSLPAGTTVTETASALTQDQLANEATLAESINSLPDGKSVTFTLAMPLRRDDSASSTGTGTVFAQHSESLGVCESKSSPTSGGYTSAASGIPNVSGVANEDLTYSDIPIEDNMACVPVEQSVAIAVRKQGVNCDIDKPVCDLPGAEFALFDQDPAAAGSEPVADGLTVDPDDASFFKSTKLKAGRYWLVETKAPTAHSLLATPITFDVSTSGITLIEGQSDSIIVEEDNAFTILVRDVTAAPLPMTGGLGVQMYAIVGLLIIAAGTVRLHRSSGSAVASRSAS